MVTIPPYFVKRNETCPVLFPGELRKTGPRHSWPAMVEIGLFGITVRRNKIRRVTEPHHGYASFSKPGPGLAGAAAAVDLVAGGRGRDVTTLRGAWLTPGLGLLATLALPSRLAAARRSCQHAGDFCHKVAMQIALRTVEIAEVEKPSAKNVTSGRPLILHGKPRRSGRVGGSLGMVTPGPPG